MSYSRITGTGSYLPEKILTNADLEKMVDTSDEWIRSRTGIEERHIAADGEYTVDLAEKAARRGPCSVPKEERDAAVLPEISRDCSKCDWGSCTISVTICCLSPLSIVN